MVEEDNGSGARRVRREASFLASLVSSSRLGVLRGRGGEVAVRWRLVLLALSAAGSLGALGCMIFGHTMLGAKLFAGVIIVLVGLLLT